MAFVLAVTGSAVGLGNVWKFPYVAGENGGGAFVIVYLFCVVLVGMPVMMSEIASAAVDVDQRAADAPLAGVDLQRSLVRRHRPLQVGRRRRRVSQLQVELPPGAEPGAPVPTLRHGPVQEFQAGLWVAAGGRANTKLSIRSVYARSARGSTNPLLVSVSAATARPRAIKGLRPKRSASRPR